MANKNLVTLGVKKLKLFKITKDDATGTTYDTGIDVPGVKEVTMNLITDDKDLTGDGAILDTNSDKQGFEVSFTNAKFSTDVMTIISGSKLTETTANGLSATLIENTINDMPNTFALGFIPKLSRGDGFKQRFMYKVAGNINVEYKEGDYSVCSFKGKGMARASDGKFDGTLIFPSEPTVLTIKNVTI